MVSAQPIRALANVVNIILGPQFVLPDNDNRSYPHQPAKIACLNAEFSSAFDSDFKNYFKTMVCEQPFRPKYLALKHAQYDVVAKLDPVNKQNTHHFDACLIVAGKFRAVNENMLFKAQLLTRKDGLIIVAGAKNSGIASLRKNITIAGSNRAIESRSQYHSLVFWFDNQLQQIQPEYWNSKNILDDGSYQFQTAPGLFSAKRVDAGSRMLANHFDGKISGNVADLGAGWGYLSAQLARRCNKITGIDLFEAEWHGIELCRHNLKAVGDGVKFNYFWHDVIFEPISAKYDWVIMNPPFHQGSTSSADLGRAFIETAASILKPNGRLLMVANRQLAYEHVIKRRFSRFTMCEEDGGYKVLLAKI